MHDTLPAYDRRRQADIISSLEASLKRTQANTTTAPSTSTSRFAFGRHRKQPGAQPSQDTAPVPVPVSVAVHSPPIDSRPSGPNVHSIAERELEQPQRRLEYITPSRRDGPDDHAQTSVLSYSGLQRCIIDLRSPSLQKADNRPNDGGGTAIPALYIENIKQSLIIAPDITGSVLIHHARECIFVLRCHQFRMHNSTDTKVIIETDSTPIIEKCENIAFAMNSHTTDKPEAAAQMAIQDFDAPSAFGEVQNWTVLDREQSDGIQAMIASEDMKNVVTRDATPESIDEILKTLSI